MKKESRYRSFDFVTPVEEGIQIIGIGKKKKRNLTSELAEEITKYLRKHHLIVFSELENKRQNFEEQIKSGISIGAFFASLLFKFPLAIKNSLNSQIYLNDEASVNQVEVNLLNNILLKSDSTISFKKKSLIDRSLEFLGARYIDSQVVALAKKMLEEKYLSYDESVRLGEFLFDANEEKSFAMLETSEISKISELSQTSQLSRHSQDFKKIQALQAAELFKGFFMSYLRVRYESREEWQGLFTSLNRVVSNEVKSSLDSLHYLKNRDDQNGNGLILSEPFNGNRFSPLLTPVVARQVKRWGLMPLYLTGENPGPKSVFNLLDLLTCSSQVSDRGCFSSEGILINLAELSPVWQSWVERRWRLRKRPFLSMIEKVLNLNQASYLITSAFHPPYLEKMIDLAEYAGYKGIVISKSGLEGGLCPSLIRDFKVICSKRMENGYRRKDFTFSIEDLGIEKKTDTKYDLEKLGVGWNVALIENYFSRKKSGEEEIDFKVRLMEKVYDTCLRWLLRDR